MKCSPITPSLGAEVSDVDLQTPISPSTASQLRQALNKHHVLVFRSQHLDREAHKAVARCFGELHTHPSRRHLARDQDPEFFLIDIKPDARQSNGETWHADITCEEVPPRASLLYLTNLPQMAEAIRYSPICTMPSMSYRPSYKESCAQSARFTTANRI